MDPISADLIVFNMDPISAIYRSNLKKGDLLIHDEAERERFAEHLSGSLKNVPLHCLHQQHHLIYEDGEGPFSCSACTQKGTGNRYSCRSCNFNLHRACALSVEIMTELTQESTKDVPFVHEHPLTLSIGTSEYTCSYCGNKGNKKDRYSCHPCKTNFDVMCVTHPARLSSFFHPQHELELKTRHHFKKCSVCLSGGEINARVYSCEECEFYLHPACATENQYVQHPLQCNNHTLVLVAAPSLSASQVVCIICRKKCKNWCYLCSICDGVYFHQECLNLEASSSMETFVGKCAEEMKMSPDSRTSSPRMPSKCLCNVPLALEKSWTVDNPGRRFLACKFYDPATKNRGCEFFKWYDQHQSEWQKDVINELVIDKELLASELKIVEATNNDLEEQNKFLLEENGILRLKANCKGGDNGHGFNKANQEKESSMSFYGVISCACVVAMWLVMFFV